MPPPQSVQDLTSTAFKDDAWLAHNVLSKYNVLEYFSRSPFYVPPQQVAEEYVIAEEQEPHLYVVHKKFANKCVAVYYVLDQTVFQAATLEAVLGARAERLLYNLTSAFGSARDLYEPTGLASSSSSRRVPPNPSEAEHERATDRLLANFFNRKVA